MADELADKLAINQVLDTYARGIDDRDWDLVNSVFTDDAFLDYTAFSGPKGPRDDVIMWVQDMLTDFVMSQHLITNRLITIDGDDAVCSAELLAIMGMPGKEPGKMSMMQTGGQYNDRLVRTSEGWKIAKRTCDRGWLASAPDASGPRSPD